MESGTLLHIALLRKTSNAKKRQKSIIHEQKRAQYNLPVLETAQQNFTLSGWNTQEQELKIHLSALRKNKKLRQSFDDQHKKIITQRVNVKTSECTNRAKLKSQSFRKYSHYRLNQNKGSQEENKLKEFNSQTCMRAETKFHKLNILYQKELQDKAQKENSSSPQFQSLSRKKDQSNKNENPHSFTNFINLNNIRARKFFKT